eukprot:171859-Amphidinium_carterae.1
MKSEHLKHAEKILSVAGQLMDVAPVYLWLLTVLVTGHVGFAKNRSDLSDARVVEELAKETERNM